MPKCRYSLVSHCCQFSLWYVWLTKAFERLLLNSKFCQVLEGHMIWINVPPWICVFEWFPSVTRTWIIDLFTVSTVALNWHVVWIPLSFLSFALGLCVICMCFCVSVPGGSIRLGWWLRSSTCLFWVKWSDEIFAVIVDSAVLNLKQNYTSGQPVIIRYKLEFHLNEVNRVTSVRLQKRFSSLMGLSEIYLLKVAAIFIFPNILVQKMGLPSAFSASVS